MDEKTQNPTDTRDKKDKKNKNIEVKLRIITKGWKAKTNNV